MNRFPHNRDLPPQEPKAQPTLLGRDVTVDGVPPGSPGTVKVWLGDCIGFSITPTGDLFIFGQDGHVHSVYAQGAWSRVHVGPPREPKPDIVIATLAPPPGPLGRK